MLLTSKPTMYLAILPLKVLLTAASWFHSPCCEATAPFCISVSLSSYRCQAAAVPDSASSQAEQLWPPPCVWQTGNRLPLNLASTWSGCVWSGCISCHCSIHSLILAQQLDVQPSSPTSLFLLSFPRDDRCCKTCNLYLDIKSRKQPSPDYRCLLVGKLMQLEEMELL